MGAEAASADRTASAAAAAAVVVVVIGGARDGSGGPRGRGGGEEPALGLVERGAGGRRPGRVGTHPSRRRIDQLLRDEEM